MSTVLCAEQRRVFDVLTARTTGSCLITGDAGTGKTTLAAEVARAFLQAGYVVLVLCPTHVAKHQFTARLDAHEHLSITTVAQFLSQRPMIDKETGRLGFSAGSFSTADAHLIIVDESSMVSEYELLEIRKAAREALVVFLGDFAQLRPVMKRQGDAYQRLKTFHLTEQHRNASVILDLCNRTRTAVTYPRRSVGSDIVVHDTRRSLLHAFLHDLRDATDPLQCCYLAYRNAVVNRVRERAHHVLYGDRPFARGQVLRLDQMCAAGHNGGLVRVVAVREHVRYRILNERFVTYRVRVRVEQGDVVELWMTALHDQPRQRVATEALFEASGRAFRRDRAQWRELREQIQRVETLVRHSSPFAGTVHKAQGRSVPRVYVDTRDISTGADKRRLLYVGYSRAMHQLHTVSMTGGG